VIVFNSFVETGNASVVRYIHPNLLTDGLKNVRIVDFAHSDGDKPRRYGNISFCNRDNGLVGKSYETFEHLKYWVTTAYNYNHLLYNDDVPGDYFIQLLDCGNIPTIKWFLSEDGRYGGYTSEYSFSGLHRVFFPHGEHVYDVDCGIRFDMVGGNKLIFVLAGFTAPINNALLLNGYQSEAETGKIAPPYDNKYNGDAILSGVCSKLAAAATSNTMVYVIKYGSGAPTTLDSCGPSGKIKTYSVTSEAALNEKLHEIAEDIKSFASYEESKIEDSNTT
jgi:hypothetical protein